MPVRPLARRASVIVGVGITSVVLAAGPASAHFCSNIQRSNTAQQKVAANSNGWLTIRTALANEFGLCPAGVDVVADAFEGAGGDADIPILANAILATGVQVQIFEGKKFSLPKPISDQDFAAFDVLEDPAVQEAAFAACESA